MATKRPKFPEIRVWIICGNFNERTQRTLCAINRGIINLSFRQFTTWNRTSRRLYRYFFYKVSEMTSTTRQDPFHVDSWNLRFQTLVRELRRRNGDYRRRWQRRIFQILELWYQRGIVPPKARHPGWQTCAQVLTSASHWKRRQPIKFGAGATWTNVLWRAAHLNKRKPAKTYDLSWQITYKIIAANRFRERKHGWMSAFTRICLKWPAQS